MSQNEKPQIDQKPTFFTDIKNYYLRRLELIERDLNERVFIFELLIIFIIISMVFIYTNNNKTSPQSIKLRQITQKAFMSFLIAYLAHIDMVTTTFFIIWLIVYYHL